MSWKLENARYEELHAAEPECRCISSGMSAFHVAEGYTRWNLWLVALSYIIAFVVCLIGILFSKLCSRAWLRICSHGLTEELPVDLQCQTWRYTSVDN